MSTKDWRLRNSNLRVSSENLQDPSSSASNSVTTNLIKEGLWANEILLMLIIWVMMICKASYAAFLSHKHVWGQEEILKCCVALKMRLVGVFCTDKCSFSASMSQFSMRKLTMRCELIFAPQGYAIGSMLIKIMEVFPNIASSKEHLTCCSDWQEKIKRSDMGAEITSLNAFYYFADCDFQVQR